MGAVSLIRSALHPGTSLKHESHKLTPVDALHALAILPKQSSVLIHARLGQDNLPALQGLRLRRSQVRYRQASPRHLSELRRARLRACAAWGLQTAEALRGLPWEATRGNLGRSESAAAEIVPGVLGLWRDTGIGMRSSTGASLRL